MPGVGGDWLKRFAVSGPTGRFSIRGLKPGAYEIAAANNELQPAFANCDASDPNRTVSLRLRRGESLRGRLTDPDGKPVADATVSFFQRTGVSEVQRRFGLMTFRGTTDRDGHFTVLGLPAEAILDVQAFGRVGGKPTHARLGEVQVGDADLQLTLGQ